MNRSHDISVYWLSGGHLSKSGLESQQMDGNVTADRQIQQLDFLRAHGWHEASREKLPQDASRRVYYRLFQLQRTIILMDAPPPENLPAFIQMSAHLEQLGQVVPRVLHADPELGLALVEDLGDQTFSRLLEQGESQQELYELALDTLIRLQQHTLASQVNIPVYDKSRMLEEAGRFLIWYFPALTGRQAKQELSDSWQAVWASVLDRLPDVPQTLVLRDFHVDNLMGVEAGGKRQCGLLDFQDAVLGPHAYDLVSLLEDARRDVPEPLRERLLQRYLQSMDLARDDFMAWYQVLGCQRHFKVAGIFMRLGLEQQRAHYLDHLPRILQLIGRHINADYLQPVRYWLENNFPEYQLLPEHAALLQTYRSSSHSSGLQA